MRGRTALGLGIWTAEELQEKELLYEAEARAALAPTPEYRLSEWAVRRVVLPPAEPVPGPLSLARTPYLAGWMDLYTNPDVTEVTAVTSTQVGKSLGLLCLLGYCVDHLRVPVLLVQAKQSTAKSFNRARVQPLFRASPGLAGYLPRGRGVTEYEIQTTNDLRLRFAGAGSPSDLAEASVPVVICDEFDKYPWRPGGKGADPIQQATERLRWWNRTLAVKTTTPTTEEGYGWRELCSAPCQARFYVRCPRCGAAQVLFFSGVKETLKVGDLEVSPPGPAGRIEWPRDEHGHARFGPEELRARRLAWYACGQCSGRWGEGEKEALLARGEWRTFDGRPVAGHVGVHLWSAYSPRLSWSDIAAKFLAARDDPDKLRAFHNDWLGLGYRQAGERPTLEAVEARRRAGYLMGQVPEDVRFLTAFVDVHKQFQYWMVWGWGLGFTGYLVAVGREDIAIDAAGGWRRVFEAVTRDYPRVDGAGSLRVGQGAGMCLMDSGWQRRQDGNPDEDVNEAEVIEICDAWNKRVKSPLFQPSKGSSRPIFPHLSWSGRTYDRTTDGKPLYGRLLLHLFDPWFFKADFYARLARPEQVGGFWLPKDLPPVIMQQMLGEEKIIEPGGRITWHAVGPNHGLDCGVGCYVGAWKFRFMLETPPPAAAASEKKPPEPEPPAGGGRFKRFRQMRRRR